MTTKDVGDRLCALCRDGENLEAIDELYADDVVSVEAAEMEGSPMPRTMEGKGPVRGKTEWWLASHEVHRTEVDGPLLHGDDRFAVVFDVDATNKESDERFQMKEVGVYTVEDGRITREEFYYAT